MRRWPQYPPRIGARAKTTRAELSAEPPADPLQLALRGDVLGVVGVEAAADGADHRPDHEAHPARRRGGRTVPRSAPGSACPRASGAGRRPGPCPSRSPSGRPRRADRVPARAESACELDRTCEASSRRRSTRAARRCGPTSSAGVACSSSGPPHPVWCSMPWLGIRQLVVLLDERGDELDDRPDLEVRLGPVRARLRRRVRVGRPRLDRRLGHQRLQERGRRGCDRVRNTQPCGKSTWCSSRGSHSRL